MNHKTTERPNVRTSERPKQVAVAIFLTIATLAGCGKSDPNIGKGPSTIDPINGSSTPPPPAPVAAAAPADAAPKADIHHGDTTITPSGLKYIDKKVGTGAEPKQGQTITVNYIGQLTNGKIFDANTGPSAKHTEPFKTAIGVGHVIKGWDEGMMSMKVGGKRRLIVPSELGYGERGAGQDIPPNATLIFDVELLKVE
jgi:peptidylprolyl isomerase